jgi:hypothetical protein
MVSDGDQQALCFTFLQFMGQLIAFFRITRTTDGGKIVHPAGITAA